MILLDRSKLREGGFTEQHKQFEQPYMFGGDLLSWSNNSGQKNEQGVSKTICLDSNLSYKLNQYVIIHIEYVLDIIVLSCC